MSILKWAKGQFIDVIEWPNEDRDTLLWRFPDNDREVKNGAQLTVRESQAAIFVNEGQVADVFMPGRHELITRNMPILTSLRSWKYGFDSPFKVDIYFINLTLFSNMKWGTRQPVRVYDPEFPSGVDLRAFGTFSFRVSDPGLFYKTFSGNTNRVTSEQMLEHFRSMIVTEFSTALKQSGKTLMEINMRANELGKDLQPIIKDHFSKIGTEIVDFFVESVTLPEEIRKELAEQDMEYRKKRREMSLENEMLLQNRAGMANLSQNIGDMQKFAQFSAANAMEKGAANPSGGGAMSDMMQMMMGMGMAQNMMQNMQGSVGTPGQAAPATNTPDADAERAKILNTLKQLGELKEAGVLSEEEFNTKKAELLARL